MPKNYPMKGYGGVEVILHAFLTSTLGGYGLLASPSGRFIPGKKLPSFLGQGTELASYSFQTLWQRENYLLLGSEPRSYPVV